nr:reverse transcriptase domain-containing protein [Tanacetum cinerariifolium]
KELSKVKKTKQKLDEEVAELKRHLQIVPNDEDDVYTEATPLVRKVPVTDYEIYTENSIPYYKIIRADGSPQLFLSFLSLLRNFDRKDLGVLWKLVKERFASSKPKNFLDYFLITTLTYMFEKPDVQAQVWKNQRTVHGLEKVKSWRLFTLDQMLNNVRLEVEKESEVSLELLRFIRWPINVLWRNCYMRPPRVMQKQLWSPSILAEQFELKHNLINMMTLDQFFGLEKDNPHDHIGATRRWKKEPPRSILNWEDLDRYKDLLCACPHHGFTELHQLDTFYNDLNPADQDSLNSTAGGNLLETRTQDVLTIIENKSKVRISRNKSIISQVKSSDANTSSSSEIAKLTHAVNQQTSAVTTAMTAILKQYQANPPPVYVKAVEEIYVTCSGAHPYYQCLAAGGNTFLELRDNIQGYITAAAVNYNQVVPLSELEKVKRINEANMKAMQTQINNVKNKLRNEMKILIQTSMSNQTNELKNMMASFFQMNTASTSGSGHLPSNTIANPKGELKAITTRSGIVVDGPSVLIHPLFINPKEDERVEETLTDQYLAEYTIKVPPPLFQKPKPPSQRNFVVHQRDPLHPNIPYPSRMHKQNQQEKDEVQIHKFWQMFKQLHINITLADDLILIPKYQKIVKALLSNKEKLLEPVNTPLNKNCSMVILKKLPQKLRDPGKFLIPCGFTGIARDIFVPVGKFTFPADFFIVDYESDLRVPLILGRPFLRTACALIDIHGEEMILRDDDERLTLNMRHDTSSYSNQPQKELINMINVFNDLSEDFLEDLFATNHQSGNPTFSSHLNLTSPEVKDDLFDPEGGNVLIEKLLDLNSTKDLHPLIINDDFTFDIEFDHKEIEYLLNNDHIKDMDSILKDLVDEDNLADLNDNLADSMPEMFTDEHVLDYSSPADFLPFPEYDSFLLENFSEVDALPSTNNEDKVFNLGILIRENLLKVITHVTSDKNAKKLAISHDFLIPEDFDPPLYELPFFKEVPDAKTPLSFSFENEEKVFKPKIHTSKEVHSFLISELSHQGYKVFKIIKILKSPMKMFLFSCEENIHILNVPCLHFYPP